MKNTVVISSPFDTYSGYGARARDVIKAILATDKYDVKLLAQRWGNTPFGFCNDNPEWAHLLKLVVPNLQQKPDIWIQITIPSEFQPVGKYNIGITAGIETTVSPGDWIEGINRIDLTLVSSNHSKQIFQNTQFDKKDKNTNQTVGITKVEKPIEVLFEGANLDIYKALDKIPPSDLNDALKEIPESFAYLFVGHWINGDLGEDRKNVGLLIKSFFETFKNKTNKPALILKTSQVGSSYMDREEILKKIKQIRKTVNSTNLPNVYLLHGEFTDEEMNDIYNHSKVKAMISLTRGEGFGRPLLEFSLTKKPIIASGWSGHIDFLKPEFSSLLNGKLTQVHPSAANQWLLAESHWFAPDLFQIGHYLKDVFENYKNYIDGAKRQAYYSKTNFSWDGMKDLLEKIMNENIPEFPKQEKLNIPLSLPKLETVNEN